MAVALDAGSAHVHVPDSATCDHYRSFRAADDRALNEEPRHGPVGGSRVTAGVDRGVASLCRVLRSRGFWNASMRMADSPAIAKVFLSFSMVHKPLVELFRHQATDSRCGLVFQDYSIKEPVEGAWKIHAERLIRRSNVTLCLVGESTWRSEPVNWEVRKSAELGNRIMAVYLESNIVRTPKALQEVGAIPMPWDFEKIMERLYDERRAVS